MDSWKVLQTCSPIIMYSVFGSCSENARQRNRNASLFIPSTSTTFKSEHAADSIAIISAVGYKMGSHLVRRLGIFPSNYDSSPLTGSNDTNSMPVSLTLYSGALVGVKMQDASSKCWAGTARSHGKVVPLLDAPDGAKDPDVQF